MRLQVGAAKLPIAPPLDQTRRAGARGLATDVFGTFCARAAVLDDGSARVALVLLDVCDFYDNVTRGIRELVGRGTNVPPRSVLVTATHTHAAPRLIDNDGHIGPEALLEPTEAYLEYLCAQAAAAVFLAESRLECAVARVAETPLPGIGRPSRIRLKDGSIASLGSTLGIKDIPPEQIESESPYDDTLRLLLFEAEDRRPLCAIANFGCHNNLALLTSTLNTDYFGWAMDRLESEADDRFVMIATPGPIGDAQPLAKLPYRQWDAESKRPRPPRRGDDLVPPAGGVLYQGIRRAWEGATPLTGSGVAAMSRFERFPWRESPTPKGLGYIHSRQVVGGEQDDRGAVAELQLIRIGELALLGICGEVFHEIAANLRARSPFEHTWTISLSNDRLLYLMPQWEYERELASGKGNTQFDQVVAGPSAESIIYRAFETMLKTKETHACHE